MVISNSNNPDELTGSSEVIIEQTHKSDSNSGPLGWLKSFGRLLIPPSLAVSTKLAISIGIMISIGMSLLGAAIIHNQTKLLNQQTHTYGRTVVDQMAQAAKEPLLANDSLLLDILTYNLAAAENVLGTAIYSTEYKIISSSGRNPFEAYAPFSNQEKKHLNGSQNILEWEWKYSPSGSLDAVSFFSPVRFRDVILGYALISYSREAMTQAKYESVRSIVVATIVLIILGIVMSYLLGRRLTRPLDSLMNASRAMELGQYDYRIKDARKDEIGHLMNSFNLMAQGMLEKSQVVDAFSRHVPPNVTKEIINNLEPVELDGKHVVGSVMFVDIVGFTAKSEAMTPQGVAQLLNEFYTIITQTIHLYKGTIDKYMGDCAMLIFGIPEEDTSHVFHSIAYAIFLQRLMDRKNAQRISRGESPVYLRIGVNTGEMLAGNMGPKERLQYTVVGDAVNLASRLSSQASADQIIISEETYCLPGIKERVIATKHQSVQIRGKSEPVTTYIVESVTGIYETVMDRQITAALTQLDEQMPLNLTAQHESMNQSQNSGNQQYLL